MPREGGAVSAMTSSWAGGRQDCKSHDALGRKRGARGGGQEGGGRIVLVNRAGGSMKLVSVWGGGLRPAPGTGGEVMAALGIAPGLQRPLPRRAGGETEALRGAALREPGPMLRSPQRLGIERPSNGRRGAAG